ncbi:MAG TPA: TlpA disulfide reductase family protein [Terriglobales bacterium]|nr:TlpA disulfide reductase family protein [Terriglobales bacterium]
MTRLLAALVLIAFVLVSFATKRELLRRERDADALPLGSIAPPLALPDRDGRIVRLDAVVGQHKAVVLTFWATWCTPCRIELPELETLYHKRRNEGLALLAINEDDNETHVSEFLQDHAMPFPVLFDAEHDAAAAYRVRAFPTTVLIDRQGKIVQIFDGFSAGLEQHVEALLKERS